MENKNMIGKFSWIELVTTDVPRSKDFYGEILGWSFWDNSSLYGNYNLALKDGKMICGIYKSSKLDGAKAHWNSYIFVEDIDHVVKQAVALGGTLERGPFEVMGMGRMASLRDPAGAWFSLWQELKQGKGLESDMSNEVGSFCW